MTQMLINRIFRFNIDAERLTEAFFRFFWANEAPAFSFY